MQVNFHENLTSEPEAKAGSNRAFGFVMATAPEDAFRCFMGTDIEVLVAGNCLLRKEEQNSSLRMNYSEAFDLD